MRRLILHWAVHWTGPREPVVPVSPLPSIQRLVYLVAYPAALLGVELLHPCVVQQSFLAGSCVRVERYAQADVRAACLCPFLTGTRRSRLVCPHPGADPSTPFLWWKAWRQNAVHLQIFELRQAWERKPPPWEGDRPVKLGGQALRDGLLSERSTVSGESPSSVRPPQPFPAAPHLLSAE